MKRFSGILAIVVILGLNALVMACPMCKDSVPNSDAQQAGGVPSGFNSSVYLLLGAFLTVLGFIATGLYRAARSTNQRFPRQ